MIRTNDGKTFKRVGGLAGDRQPLVGFNRQRALYTAAGGETSIDLQTLSPQLSYYPGQNQITVKRSSGATSISGLDFYESSATTIGFPVTDPLVAGEIVEVIREFAVTGIAAIPARPDVHTETATAGQTLVTLPFSYPYNFNQSKATGAILVYLHGVLQSRGVDYTEVNQSTGNSNQIQFVDPLVGGENVIVVPAFQVLDQSAAASTFVGNQNAQIQNFLAAGTQAFVDESAKISVPSTTIINRAKIPNIAGDLRASFGVDRVMTQAIYEIQTEFGPNGERVWGVLGDDRGLVRFVGTWPNVTDTSGVRPSSFTASDYLEITFYGTGLNILVYNNASISFPLVVDGGAATTLTSPAGASAVLGARNYAMNTVLPVVSGLTLGVHTVKITNASAALNFFGYEVINAASVTSLNVNPGNGYIGGQKYTSLTSQSLAYNSGVTGTRGGRSVPYLTAAGTLGMAFQAVNTSAAFLSSADHTNEEPVRSYTFREFGAGRSDDFSTLPASPQSDRAFTLDDGLTTLIGRNANLFQNPVGAAEALAINSASGNYVNFVFIGTGLDIQMLTDTSARAWDSISIDGGASVGSASISASSNPLIKKIVSGLPYGTHSVRLAYSSTSFAFIGKFIVYQPKKPSIPAGAIELADFNVMANYVANGTFGVQTIGAGLLRRNAMREVGYVGTWQIASIDVTNFACGFNLNTVNAGSYAELTFFGTGVDLRPYLYAGAHSFTVSIDGASNLSSYTTAFNYGSTGLTFSASTGTVTGTQAAATAGATISVSGLTLGIHKVRITQNTTTQICLDSIDVITPIHSPRSAGAVVLQNTLTIGNSSMSDSRKTSAIKEILPVQKARAQAVGIANSPTTSSTSMVPMPDMSLTFKSSGGIVDLSYTSSVQSTGVSGGFITTQLYVDGVAVGTLRDFTLSSTGLEYDINDRLLVSMAPGIHKIDLYWATNSGQTVSASFTRRTLIAIDL